jgi:small-conductance mechanosensitive channel
MAGCIMDSNLKKVALGVVIGFSLQEIIANFISGLIILFERPVRVGDIVTVDNIDGVVSRIQIRATTIPTTGIARNILFQINHLLPGKS